MNVFALPADFSGVGSYRVILPCLYMRDNRACNLFMAPTVTIPAERTEPGKDGRQWDQINQTVNLQAFSRHRIDVFVIQIPSNDKATLLIEAAKDADAVVIAEIDDYVWNLAPGNAAYDFWTPERLTTLEHNLALADLVTVSTPTLAKLLSTKVGHVKVIRNRLHWNMWARERKRTWERLRVGWMGSHVWHAGAPDILKEHVVPWLERHPDVDFVAAGDPDLHDKIGTPEGQRVSIDGCHFDDLPSLMQFDIGLVPLEQTVFNEAKSCLKGMEYAAAGIPFVASPMPEYRWLEDTLDGAGMRVCPEELWADALDDLLPDPWLGQSWQIRKKAQRLTLTWHWPDWSLAYKEVQDRVLA